MSKKTTILPDNILRRMDKKDRVDLGKAGVTAEEANEKQQQRNEREVHRQIENWLRLKGIWFSHSRMDRKTTQALGTPDFIFSYIYMGAMIDKIPTAVEVKVGGNKLTPEQESVRMSMLANGWTYHIVSSLEQLKAITRL